jgi:hypothetical protein
MACSATSDSHQALRGQILALRRLDFDRQVPEVRPAAESCCVGCGDSEHSESRFCGYGWSLGENVVRPLCKLSALQVEQALREAQSLLNRGYRNLQGKRSALGKPICV